MNNKYRIKHHETFNGFNDKTYEYYYIEVCKFDFLGFRIWRPFKRKKFDSSYMAKKYINEVLYKRQKTSIVESSNYQK